MYSIEKFYLEHRKNALRTEIMRVEDSKGKIPRKQFTRSIASLTARVSEIDKFINFSEASGQDLAIENVSSIANEILIEENTRLKKKLDEMRRKTKSEYIEKLESRYLESQTLLIDVINSMDIDDCANEALQSLYKIRDGVKI